MIGNRTRVKVGKNKVAPPFKMVEFDIIYGEGISSTGELIDLAVEADVIQKSGSWYSYGDVKIGQGREATKQWLLDEPGYREEIRHTVRRELGMLPADEMEGDSVAEEPELAVNGK